MHLEIDRIPDDQAQRDHESLTKVLTDVRDAVEDWQRMHAQVDRIVDGPRGEPAAVARRGARAG